MARAWKLYRLMWLVVGVVLGLSFAGYWPQTPLYATATDRADSVAIATGPLESGIEALYILDFLTGDLKAVVLGRVGKFQGLYTYNILSDFGVDLTKNPRFAMVTGMADIRPQAGASVRPSASVLYVAETTTGKVAAYAIPWQSGALNVPGRRITGVLQPLDIYQFRAINRIREGTGAN